MITADNVKPIPNIPHRSSKPIYDEMEHQHFTNALKILAGSTQAVLERKALKRFYEEGERQAVFVEREKLEAMQDLQSSVGQKRQESLLLFKRQQVMLSMLPPIRTAAFHIKQAVVYS